MMKGERSKRRPPSGQEGGVLFPFNKKRGEYVLVVEVCP